MKELNLNEMEQVSGGARLPNGVTLNAKPGYVLKGFVNNMTKWIIIRRK